MADVTEELDVQTVEVGPDGSPAPAVDEHGHPADEHHIVLDELRERLDTFKLLSASDGAADALLDRLDVRGPTEQQILFELGAWKPLFRPDRFMEAHHVAMRAFEVLERNGARRTTIKKLGPLNAVGKFTVQLATRMIVRSYESDAIDAVRNLYIRRMANAPTGSKDLELLRRARLDAERVSPTYKRKNPLGLPTFLFGGAVLSTALNGLRSAGGAITDYYFLLIPIVLLVLGIFVFAGWSVLRGAAVARRRIRLTMDQPLKALWEIVGAAGNPPKDEARDFAIYALILMALSWIIVPLFFVILVWQS